MAKTLICPVGHSPHTSILSCLWNSAPCLSTTHSLNGLNFWILCFHFPGNTDQPSCPNFFGLCFHHQPASHYRNPYLLFFSWLQFSLVFCLSLHHQPSTSQDLKSNLVLFSWLHCSKFFGLCFHHQPAIHYWNPNLLVFSWLQFSLVFCLSLHHQPSTSQDLKSNLVLFSWLHCSKFFGLCFHHQPAIHYWNPNLLVFSWLQCSKVFCLSLHHQPSTTGTQI